MNIQKLKLKEFQFIKNFWKLKNVCTYFLPWNGKFWTFLGTRPKKSRQFQKCNEPQPHDVLDPPLLLDTHYIISIWNSFEQVKLTTISWIEVAKAVRSCKVYKVSRLSSENCTTWDRYNVKTAFPIVGFHMLVIMQRSRVWLDFTFWFRPIVLSVKKKYYECNQFLKNLIHKITSRLNSKWSSRILRLTLYLPALIFGAHELEPRSIYSAWYNKNINFFFHTRQ